MDEKTDPEIDKIVQIAIIQPSESAIRYQTGMIYGLSENGNLYYQDEGNGWEISLKSPKINS